MRLAEIFRDAKGFVGDWKWYEITKVEFTQREGASWVWDDARAKARIEMGLNTELGALYHEVFHSAFHASPLHSGEDERWGDAWCDAFRYFHDAGFRAKIDLYCRMTFEQARSHGDWSSDKVYAFPCSLIVKKCDRNYAELKKLWFQLCERRRVSRSDILADCFSYDIARGEFRQTEA
jgi:hypothetical protein